MNMIPKIKLQRTDILPIVIWISILFMTWSFMHAAEHYLELTPQSLGKYFELRWILIFHITAGGGALILGIIQFWPKLRNCNWRLHRLIGILYLLAIFVSSSCALVLSFTTAYKINWGYAFTLQIWASVWITSTCIAYYAALRKNFLQHQQWMVRSYIVTIGFLISGFAYKLPFMQALSKTEDIGTPLFWMGWSVPLYIYEIIRSSRK